MRLVSALGGALLTVSIPLLSQVVPSAQSAGTSEFFVGGGASDINPDDGHGKIFGETLWVDYSLPQLGFLGGLGAELEGRDVSFDHPASEAITREDDLLVGPTYSLRRFDKVRPYVKVLFGFGNLDYHEGDKRLNHASTMTSFGGGFDLRVPKVDRLWIRAEYEYQYFPNFWVNGNYANLWIPGTPKSEQAINPQGITIGVLYRFSHGRRIN